MKPKYGPVRTALEESIQHWKRFADGKSKPGETHYGTSCALCKMFVSASGECDGCPIKNRTGLDSCKSTPWEHCEDMYSDGINYQDELFKSAAKEQLKFLISLRKDVKREH